MSTGQSGISLIGVSFKLWFGLVAKIKSANQTKLRG